MQGICVIVLTIFYQIIVQRGENGVHPLHKRILLQRKVSVIISIENSRILVCARSFDFNYTYARSIGHNSHNDFWSGVVDGYQDRLSWVGNTSLTYKEVKELIYPNTEYNFTIIDKEDETMTKVETMNYKDCYEIHNFNTELTLVVNLPSIAIFIDPFSSIFHRLGRNIIKGTVINIGNKINEADTIYYLLQLSEVKRSSKKFFCKEQTHDKEYAQCINNNLQKSFKSQIGCLPPWIVDILPNCTDLDQCPDTVVYSNLTEAAEKRNILKEFIRRSRYQSQVELESQNECAPPCEQLIVNAEQSYYSTGRILVVLCQIFISVRSISTSFGPLGFK